MDKDKQLTLRPPPTMMPTLPDGGTKWDALAAMPVKEQLRLVEDMLEAKTGLIQRFLQNTDETDWDDFHGKPRLNEKGAIKGAAMCFLDPQIGDPELVESEREPDGERRLLYFCYQTKGRICSPWAQPFPCVGSVDSDFSIHCDRKDDKGNPIKLPAWQVNRSKVRNHSATQCLVRGVTGALGLKRLTWDDLSGATNGKVTRARVQIANKKGQSALKDVGGPPPREPAPPQQPNGNAEAEQPPEEPGAPMPEEQRLWEGLKGKAKAVQMSNAEFWALIIRTIPRLDMPTSREEVAQVVAGLSRKDLQLLWQAVDQAADAPGEREPGSDG